VHEERTLAEMFNRELPIITESNSFDPNRDEYDPDPEANETALSPLTYLAGPVEVVYDGNPTNTVVNGALDQLVDIPGKKISSISGELQWDYDQGLVTLNSPKAKGICGFPKDSTYQLGTVSISTSNDYVVVNVVSLDGKDLADSERILIQTGTKYRPTNWDEVPTSFSPSQGADKIEGYRIESLGRMPWKASNTLVTVTIDNQVIKSAYKLDVAGYEESEFYLEPLSNGLRVRLPYDAMYTVLDTRSPNVVTDVEEEPMDRIQLYPNPNRGSLNLYIPETFNPSGISTIEVLDVTGRPVDTVPFEEGKSIDINLASGTYFIRLRSSTGIVHSQRIVVN